MIDTDIDIEPAAPLAAALAAPTGVLALHPQAATRPVAALAPAPEPSPRGGVTVLALRGPFDQRGGYFALGYDQIAATFDAAVRDADAVVLAFDSPGGSVAGLEEALERMSRSKRWHGTKVVAYVDEFAASAAYWLASTLADEIIVPTAGQVGSIGVIGAWVDMSGALADRGIKIHVHRAPDGKAPGMSAAPVEDVADERMAADVARVASRFTAAVAKARDLDPDAVVEMDGAMYEGHLAVKAGLADRVGSLEVAVARARELAREDEPTPNPRASMTTPTAPPASTSTLLRLQAESMARRHGLDVDAAHRRVARDAGRAVSGVELARCREVAARNGVALEQVIDNWQSARGTAETEEPVGIPPMPKSELTAEELARVEAIAERTGAPVEDVAARWAANAGK